MSKTKYPFHKVKKDGAILWRRITEKGMVTREGTLSAMRRFTLKNDRINMTVGEVTMTNVGSSY